ncbi:MAG: hypothetical protein GZ091_18755 [Paludibacter sp.]|nr:hypothetical protein [Paludibacter sp.]
MKRSIFLSALFSFLYLGIVSATNIDVTKSSVDRRLLLVKKSSSSPVVVLPCKIPGRYPIPIFIINIKPTFHNAKHLV